MCASEKENFYNSIILWRSFSERIRSKWDEEGLKYVVPFMDIEASNLLRKIMVFLLCFPEDMWSENQKLFIVQRKVLYLRAACNSHRILLLDDATKINSHKYRSNYPKVSMRILKSFSMRCVWKRILGGFMLVVFKQYYQYNLSNPKSLTF